MRVSLLDQNRQLIRRFIAGLNQGNPDIFDALLASDFIDHTPSPGALPNRYGCKSAYAMARAAFPDLRFRIEDEISEGDRVVVRSRATGTHRGMFMSLPATGKEVTIDIITIFRIADNRIVGRWTLCDALALLEKLGALPPAG